ncbi:MAG: SipW-dependent-type signal peptide-containing protein [Promicromonosporaceae bacterium]|nr:SipW-dependent-type signal peptide-containing protein [Promicromonosporaceae bacterium]
MKKTTKAIVAGLAGALLLGGGATFALWTDTASIGDDTVSTGWLTIDDAHVVLTDESFDVTGSPEWDVTDLMVPGDTVRATITEAPADLVDYEGRNLLWEVTFDGEATETHAPFIVVTTNDDDLYIEFHFPLTDDGDDWGTAHQDVEAFSLSDAEIRVTQVRGPATP